MKKLLVIAIALGVAATIAVVFFDVKPSDVSAKLTEAKTKVMSPVTEAQQAADAATEAQNARMRAAEEALK